MKNFLTSILIILVLSDVNSQVIINNVTLVSNENIKTDFCFNNTKLMTGKSISDRYMVYYNNDTIFLNAFQSGIWEKRIVSISNNIQSATLTRYKDTIWVCWKEGVFINACFTSNNGILWSKVMNVSTAGKVSAPSIYASDNGKIHFIWSQESITDTTVNYRVYENGKLSDSIFIISNISAQGLWPTVIATGDTVLCAWKEVPTVVWFRSSFDGGKSWGNTSLTTPLLSQSKDPNLCYAYDATTDTHYTYLAYDGNNKIYFQRSTDFGKIWTDPIAVSNKNKFSQFAHLDCNNKGFVGISYEQRPKGSSNFDDTKKDVGFTYSTNWGKDGVFSIDTLAYTKNGFGSAYPAFNKTDENNFYLTWLTKDTIQKIMKVFERHIQIKTNSDVSFNNKTNMKIIIYPNPFSYQAILQTVVPMKNASIVLYNYNAKVVLQINNINGREIVLTRGNLASGLYFIRLIEENKILTTEKFQLHD